MAIENILFEKQDRNTLGLLIPAAYTRYEVENILFGQYNITFNASASLTIESRPWGSSDQTTFQTYSGGSVSVTFIEKTQVFLTYSTNGSIVFNRVSSYVGTVDPPLQLDTITATSTYTYTGPVSVIAYGGGNGGPGGTSGAISSSPVTVRSNASGGGIAIATYASLPGSVPVVVGAGGPGGSASNIAGSVGGNTSFGTLVAAGGGAQNARDIIDLYPPAPITASTAIPNPGRAHPQFNTYYNYSVAHGAALGTENFSTGFTGPLPGRSVAGASIVPNATRPTPTAYQGQLLGYNGGGGAFPGSFKIGNFNGGPGGAGAVFVLRYPQ